MDCSNSVMADIEAVVFDYGGVLCYPPTDGEMREFADLAGMAYAEFRRLYGQNRGPYDSALITAGEYWRAAGEVAGLAYSEDQVRALIAMDMRVWSRMDQRMIDLVARLQDAGVKTAILSNMQTDRREIFRSEAKWLRHFDVQVFSCDVGLVKPDPEIYRRLLAEIGVPPQRVLFIDDLPLNIEAARLVGIGGMVYRSFDELSHRLAPLMGKRDGNGRGKPQETPVVEPIAHCD